MRYADDAVLVANSRKKLQKMLDKLNIACKIYGMALNVKKTKVMIVSNSKQEKCDILFDNSILEQVSHYKNLGSWITEDARCEEAIRTRIGMAKAAFWKNKEVMRRNICFLYKDEDTELLCVLCSKLWM